jgi:hypothetical protein
VGQALGQAEGPPQHRALRHINQASVLTNRVSVFFHPRFTQGALLNADR